MYIKFLSIVFYNIYIYIYRRIPQKILKIKVNIIELAVLETKPTYSSLYKSKKDRVKVAFSL